MQSFFCDNCGSAVFFENDRCLACGAELGFAPDRLGLGTLNPGPQNHSSSSSRSHSGGGYQYCANAAQQRVCNWLVPAGDPDPFCVAYRLNEIIPDLSVPGNVTRWQKLELAKRRCIYTLLRLGLPVDRTVCRNGSSLRFRFLGDPPEGPPVMTGHDGGQITINIAEADEDERERRRLRLHKPYRTLVGHFRHEIGHYYWDRLIADSPNLPAFRQLFGDETKSYEDALAAYYRQGPPPDWNTRTVTAYASVHPWEDWAETWAHYLHLTDTLETAMAFGVRVEANGASPAVAWEEAFRRPNRQIDFDTLLDHWQPLTCALNAINRGMGLPDLYPFVLPALAIAKLRFVHELISALGPDNTDAPRFQQLSVGPVAEAPQLLATH